MINNPIYGANDGSDTADPSQPTDWFIENAPDRPPSPGSVPSWSNLHNGNGPQLAPGTILQSGVNPLTGLRNGVNPADLAKAAGKGIVGPGGDFRSLVNQWQQNHPANNPDMDGLIKFLGEHGVQAQRATHAGGLSSDDKLTYNGGMYDLGSSLGSGEGRWFTDFSADQGGNGNGQASISNFSYPEYGKSFDYPAFTEQFDYKPWDRQFIAPTGATEQNDPGFGFRQSVGEDAILRGAAKTGVARTQGTIKDLAQFNQDYASNEYGQVYNRALTGYQSDLNDYLAGLTRAQDIYGTKVNAYNMNRGNAAGNFGINYGIYGDNRNASLAAAGFNLGAQGQGFNQNLAMLNYGQGAQNQAFNQQYSLANLGLTAAQLYGNQATGYGNNVAGIYTNNANRAGDYTAQIGNANAAGQVGSANAWNNALGGVSNDAMLALMARNQGRGIYGTASSN